MSELELKTCRFRETYPYIVLTRENALQVLDKLGYNYGMNGEDIDKLAVKYKERYADYYKGFFDIKEGILSSKFGYVDLHNNEIVYGSY